MILIFLLLLFSLICFLLAAFNVGLGRINTIALGLAFFVTTFLIEAAPAF